MQHHATSDSAKAGAPIAQVLNETASFQNSTDPAPATHIPSAAPFSGKLVDLLLDVPEQLLVQERRRGEHQYEEPSRINGDNAVITLPQPLQRPSKTVERARIPPLLQGLHQPPPLPPSDRLFPPITDGASGFEQDIRDRFNSANASHEVQAKRKRVDDTTKAGGLKDSSARSPELGTESALGHDQEGISLANRYGREPREATKATKGRKRKKWSDEETRDLLLGVSRFGIGKWKRILKCPDYKFVDRTAVDLKDRFRVCCPGEGLKARPSKAKGKEAEIPLEMQRNTAISTSCVDDAPHIESITEEDTCTRKPEPTQSIGHSKLVELGIQTPFAPSTRRPRRGFSVQDDQNLLKGYEKYGAAWRSIRADEHLGFMTRHTTDLRDRFRIRYPDIFVQAGYKGKSDANIKRAKSDGAEIPTSRTSHNEFHSTVQGANKTRRKPVVIENSDSATQSPERVAQAKQHLIPSSAPEHHSSMPINDQITTEKDGMINSVVLNRNILQWADANTFLMTPSSNLPVANQAPNDMSMHISIPNDTLHINPLATLNLPMMAYTSPSHFSGTPFGNYHSNSNSNLLTVPVSSSTSVPRIAFAVDPATPHNHWQQHQQHASRVSSSDALLRTPNLPTIVFPHVPAASARTMVHNLPAPADLLSGMDLDAVEGQGQFDSGHEMR